jgi:hypothetical protein
VTYIEELIEVIRRAHNAEARHVKSVPVKEVFQGKTIWDGVVEVFDLIGHSKAKRVYAWSHDTDNGKKRHVTVLHISPVDTPKAAVMAAIVQEYRNAEEA